MFLNLFTQLGHIKLYKNVSGRTDEKLGLSLQADLI